MSKISNGVSIAEKATRAWVASQNVPMLSTSRFEGDLADGSRAKDEKYVSVKSCWTHSSPVAGAKRHFTRSHTASIEVARDGGVLRSKPIVDSMPSTSVAEESIGSYSSAVRREVVIYKKPSPTTNGSAEFILEIWGSDGIAQTVNLSDFEAHGDVYLDSEFGKVAVDAGGTKIAYVAEERRPKSQPFTKRHGAAFSEGDEEEKSARWAQKRGKEHEFREEWGEQMEGKSQTVVVTFDANTSEMHVWTRKAAIPDDDDGRRSNDRVHRCLPNDACVGQVEWDDLGENLFGIGVGTSPRRLGIMYCTNRPSHVFRLNVESAAYTVVSNQGSSISCRSPKFVRSVDGAKKFLVWLERDLGSTRGIFPGPHQAASRLMKVELPGVNAAPQTCIDVVGAFDPETDAFPGLFNASFPKHNCVLPSETAALSLVVNCTRTHYPQPIVCNVESGSCHVVEGADHVVVHDVSASALGGASVIVGGHSTPTEPPKVVVGSVAKTNGGKFALSREKMGSDDEGDDRSLAQSVFKTFYHVPPGDGSSSVKFNSFYVGPPPTTGEEKKTPLLAWIHGGPQSVFPSTFLPEMAYFLRMGYGVLAVNYRGSLGSGEDCVTSLLGHIGDRDVKDCVQAVDECLEAVGGLDPARIFLFGGSHGGFLVAHLAAQYPTKFKAVVARNPVIDLPSMLGTTDIPDWTFNEAGLTFDPTARCDRETLLRLLEASPSSRASSVEAPILLMVGKNDLRVPPHQGISFYHQLKAMGKDVQMNVYEDNHPLAKVPVHADVMINTAIFFNKVANS